MKREYRLRDMIKEGILDIFYIWKDELKNVFKDEGVLIFFFLVPFAYPLLYSFIYNNEVVREAKMVVVDQSDSYLSREFTRRVNATPDVRVVAVSTDMEEANLFPLRHYFLIYVDQALNGRPFFYSWAEYAWLMGFLVLPFLIGKNLKNALLYFKYIP